MLLDQSGDRKLYRRWSWLNLTPKIACALACDAISLLRTLLSIRTARIWRLPSSRLRLMPAEKQEIAYLFPYPRSRFEVGGAMSHVRGFLGGLKLAGAKCEIYSGRPLADEDFQESLVPLRRRPFFFWEARSLAYNWRFARAVRACLKSRRPTAFYQRHGRFVVAGALLARKLKIPLVLEYNGSEVWVAENWDPVHFRKWLRLCEEYSLRSASLIVVVSEPLQQELAGRGIPAERILVNPNGVDPAMFHPGCGGTEARRELGLAPGDVVAVFVGTFSYWHGIEILQEAADRLLRMAETDASLRKLRFLLVGDGPLRTEAAEKLKPWVAAGKVIFTGSVSHRRVPAYLDAADILLSPHIPFSDGSNFFGSPTKLFEYMAMGKAIVASNLGQIGALFSHGTTGWLVTPGSADELVTAIAYLLLHPEVRAKLGARVRQAVLEGHTWKLNAQRVLTFGSGREPGTEPTDVDMHQASVPSLAPEMHSLSDQKAPRR